jgi:enamine deaminase RidA (YjgF/YER057c/UK114 family)
MSISETLRELGLEVPPAQIVPNGVRLTYRRLSRWNELVYVAGHGPTWGDGWGSPLGKVGGDLTLEEGAAAAQLTALNILGTIDRELGSLDAVQQWLSLTGYVNGAPGFTEHATVLNGCSDLLLTLYGDEKLASRASVGVPDLPFNMPVEISAVLIWKAE